MPVYWIRLMIRGLLKSVGMLDMDSRWFNLTRRLLLLESGREDLFR